MKYQIGFLIPCFIFLVSCQDKNENTQNVIEYPPAMCAPITTDKEWYKSDNVAPLFEGLDVLKFPITTDNPLVQKYFNQGLALSYAFNHAEAARSFYYATKLDPKCAMAFWGYAYVLGPNYNAGMEDDNYERAFEAIQEAITLSSLSSEKEQAMIKAMSLRYVKEPVSDRSELDIEYSRAFQKLHKAFPNDADICAIYAESLMNLHPWDLWEKDGNIKPWTQDILDALLEVLTIDPNHIGAHHFYIHAVEASSSPERGLPSAQILDDGLAAGFGHLVHMPSHIYIRTGDYHKGTVANIRAAEVDSNYITLCHAQGAYPLAYYPHNYHFLAGTATLEGNSHWAIKAAKKVSGQANKQVMKEPGWGTLQHYYTIPYYVYVKFGKWDEILKMKNEVGSLKYPTAVRHYARGMAFLGKNNISAAKEEHKLLEILADNKELEEVTVWDINSVYTLLQIARRVLQAEILASESNFEESIQKLKEAIDMEDELNYDEPPDWFFSVRHHLGAVQIEAGKQQEAIKTYEEDLTRLPKNGWALHGMKLAYNQLNDSENTAIISEKLKEVWATADIKLSTSRIK